MARRKYIVKERFPFFRQFDQRHIPAMHAGPQVFVFADLESNEDPVVFEYDNYTCAADRKIFIASTEAG